VVLFSGYITTALKLASLRPLGETDHRTLHLSDLHPPLSTGRLITALKEVMTSPHKRLKGKKAQVTFSSTTTTIPSPKMSYYPQQQHQYQSPQTYAYGQMPTYQPQSTCTYGVYSARLVFDRN